MRKNIASESTNVAALKSSANQRAIDLGVAMTASAPITGSRIIQVRSLVNITVLSSLHKVDQHNNDGRQHRYAPKETDHVALDLTGLHVAYIAAQRRHETSHTID